MEMLLSEPCTVTLERMVSPSCTAMAFTPMLGPQVLTAAYGHPCAT